MIKYLNTAPSKAIRCQSVCVYVCVFVNLLCPSKRDDFPSGALKNIPIRPTVRRKIEKNRACTLEATCGCSHFTRTFGVNAVNDHYNCIVLQLL